MIPEHAEQGAVPAAEVPTAYEGASHTPAGEHEGIPRDQLEYRQSFKFHPHLEWGTAYGKALDPCSPGRSLSRGRQPTVSEVNGIAGPVSGFPP